VKQARSDQFYFFCWSVWSSYLLCWYLFWSHRCCCLAIFWSHTYVDVYPFFSLSSLVDYLRKVYLLLMQIGWLCLFHIDSSVQNVPSLFLALVFLFFVLWDYFYIYSIVSLILWVAFFSHLNNSLLSCSELHSHKAASQRTRTRLKTFRHLVVLRIYWNELQQSCAESLELVFIHLQHWFSYFNLSRFFYIYIYFFICKEFANKA